MNQGGGRFGYLATRFLNLLDCSRKKNPKTHPNINIDIIFKKIPQNRQ